MKTYIISIPQPCSQDWEKMNPQSNGRHCYTCNKVVVDFSTMSDQEISEFLIKNTSACARIPSQKLNTSIQYLGRVKKRKYHWPGIAALIVAGMFTLTPIVAQTPQKIYDKSIANPKYFNEITTSLAKADSIGSAKETLAKTESHFIIKGQVITKDVPFILSEGSTDTLPHDFYIIPNAKITILKEGNQLQEITADQQGKFEIKIDNKYINKWLDLKVSADGMDEKTIYRKYITKEETKEFITIELERTQYILGRVAVIRQEPIMIPGTIGSRIDLDYFIDFYFGR